MNSQTDFVIIGAGVIGLSIGWQLVRRGVRVTLLEKNQAGGGASHVAAGMLAPHAEVGFEEVGLLKFGEYSLQLYPQFVSEIKADSGIDPDFTKCGTQLVGIGRDDSEYLRRLYDFRKELGLYAEWTGGSAARDREPLLAPRITSGVWLPNDGQVNNRRLLASLIKGFRQLGGRLHENTEVKEVEIYGEHDFTVHTGESEFHARSLVVATGCRMPDFKGLPEEELPPVRPVKGQILSLRSNREVNLSHIIRTPRVYLVPKSDGLIRVGATSEEMGFDTNPTAGGLKELLDEAWETVPAIYELEIEEFIAGLRPASPDHGPVIGKSAVPGLSFATGHYRHGILLAPVTAYELVKELVDDETSDHLVPWKPGRFKKNTRSLSDFL
ncbi:MAG: glycine oxidase ThiO [Balneolaceae bacterium]